MSKKYLVVLFVIILTASQASAQRTYNFFYGKILDEVTRKGIPDANIYFEGSQKGSVSNTKGEFSFYIDTLPVLMVVSHLGYETRKLYLDKTSYSLTIYLQPKVQQLKEIVVSGKTEAETVFRDQYLNVIDYEVDTGNIFILADDIRSTRSALFCKNSNGDTIGWNKNLTVHPKQLFRDCLGNIHILSGDSAYQVFRDSTRLWLIYPVGLKKFNEVLLNCVFATSDMLFIRKFEKADLAVSYFKVSRKNNQKQVLTTIEDTVKTKMLRRNPHDNSLLMQPKQPVSRDDFVDWSYVHKILYRPVSTALTKIGDFICIFNSVEKTIEFYQMDGVYAFKVQLMVDKIRDGSWSKSIFIDEEKSKVYTTFVQNGYSSLYALDLNNGNLKKVLSLIHLYPEKLEIHDGFVYYLYHEAASGDNKVLFRHSVY